MYLRKGLTNIYFSIFKLHFYDEYPCLHTLLFCVFTYIFIYLHIYHVVYLFTYISHIFICLKIFFQTCSLFIHIFLYTYIYTSTYFHPYSIFTPILHTFIYCSRVISKNNMYFLYVIIRFKNPVLSMLSFKIIG